MKSVMMEIVRMVMDALELVQRKTTGTAEVELFSHRMSVGGPSDGDLQFKQSLHGIVV